MGNKIDYVSICSPNYLHDAHIRYGLRIGANVICEKPLVLNPWNLDALIDIEKEHTNKVNTILQLRYHPSIIELKNKIDKGNPKKQFNVDLTYITSRGNWYHNSWKGDENKSGGVATNIGIHFFDMLQWIFGPMKSLSLNKKNNETNSGILILEKAEVKWYLSISKDNLPSKSIEEGVTSYRNINIDGHDLEFSDGFTDLHTTSYKEILKNNGFGMIDSKHSIEIVSKIRNLNENIK